MLISSPDHDGGEVEVAPVRLDGSQSDVGGRWHVERGARVRRLLGDRGVGRLVGGEDAVDHGVEWVPDGILRRDVDGVHGSADAEMRAGVDAERAAADDTVEVEFEAFGAGGVDGCAGLRRGRVGVDHILVQIADQAAWVVVECGGRERAVDDERRVDGEHGGLVVGEWS